MSSLRLDWEGEFVSRGRITSERSTAARSRQASGIASQFRSEGGRGQTALRGFLRRVKTEPPIPHIMAATELAVLRRLQGADSRWPVHTGFSKANFFFVGTEDRAQLSNRANYAAHVEQRTGVIADVLADPTITDDAERVLERYAR